MIIILNVKSTSNLILVPENLGKGSPQMSEYKIAPRYATIYLKRRAIVKKAEECFVEEMQILILPDC